MQININNCDICGSNIKKKATTYRAYDSTLCSQSCAAKKYKQIATIDPTYNKPTSWQSTNKMTRTKSELYIDIFDTNYSKSIYDEIKQDIPYTRIYRTPKEYELYTQTYNGIKFLYILGTSVSLYTIQYLFNP